MLPHYRGLKVPHHGISQPQKNILRGHTLLLPVDQIRFCEHTAAACQAWNAGSPVRIIGIGFQRQTQAVHLILKESSGSRCALAVYRIFHHLVTSQSRQETGSLRADLQNALRLRIQQLLTCQKRCHPVCHLHFTRFLEKESRSAIHCGILDDSRIGMIQFFFHGFQHLT